MTTYEAAVRLLAAETPEEKERAERAYLATWTAAPPAAKAKRAKAKAVPPNNVVSLAEWKAKVEAATMQTGSK
jgi:hypothetical protein